MIKNTSRGRIDLDIKSFWLTNDIEEHQIKITDQKCLKKT